MVLILSPSLADRQVLLSTEQLLSDQWEAESAEEDGPVKWINLEGEELSQGIRIKIQHPKVRMRFVGLIKDQYDQYLD